MKNRFVFIVGILTLTIIIWATTMLAIKNNSSQEKPNNKTYQAVFVENNSNFF